jgi:hypothetical protein
MVILDLKMEIFFKNENNSIFCRFRSTLRMLKKKDFSAQYDLRSEAPASPGFCVNCKSRANPDLAMCPKCNVAD